MQIARLRITTGLSFWRHRENLSYVFIRQEVTPLLQLAAIADATTALLPMAIIISGLLKLCPVAMFLQFLLP